jgi:AraC-like DNA-binding protein
MQHQARRAKSASQSAATLAPICAFVADHITEVPTLGQLAAMAGMSRCHFSRVFHAVVGMPLRVYVTDARLKRASELLATDLSLTSIAAECGFYDLPHFDKSFRRRFGMSPRQFRQQRAASTSG